MSQKKKIALLGSTGSVGRSTLEVVSAAPDQFDVVGLACGDNVDLLRKQIDAFHPKRVSVRKQEVAAQLEGDFPHTEVFWGDDGLCQVATAEEADMVVCALVGARGIESALKAIQAGKDIALANKEVLVSAGKLITQEALKAGVTLLPIDSEHSALFQALQGSEKSSIRKLTLTASGGPFLNRPLASFDSITVREALQHPSWSMGDRITIDSATMMNKGFEVIEAHWLFGVEPSQLEVVIHPESIVHGVVNFEDGNSLACLSVPDMKAPIAYALSYPKRIRTEVPSLSLSKVANLHFSEPDVKKFPLLKLSFEALSSGGLYPCVLNAADEVAVSAFLSGKISFSNIYSLIADTLSEFRYNVEAPTLSNIIESDQWARDNACERMKAMIA